MELNENKENTSHLWDPVHDSSFKKLNISHEYAWKCSFLYRKLILWLFRGRVINISKRETYFVSFTSNSRKILIINLISFHKNEENGPIFEICQADKTSDLNKWY